MSFSSAVSIPTYTEKMHNKHQFSGKDMSSHDWALLKKSDPFLYFSIPAMRIAEFVHQGVDVPTLNIPLQNESVGSLSKVREEQPITVYRKSRVSSECHGSLILEHMLNLYSSKNVESDTFEDSEEDFYSLLKDYASRER
jgi:hypothetical protein